MLTGNRRRVLAKTATYRLVSVVVTVVVAYLVVGDGRAALGVGLGANLLKTGVYYCHERAWQRLAPLPPRGRPEEEP